MKTAQVYDNIDIVSTILSSPVQVEAMRKEAALSVIQVSVSVEVLSYDCVYVFVIYVYG